MKPGEQQTLMLALEADQCARLELDTELDFSITLHKPDGTTSLLMDIAGEEWAPAPLTIVAAQGGRHSLELRLPDGATGGSVQASVRRASSGDRARSETGRRRGASARGDAAVFQSSARESRLAAVDHYKQAAEIFTALDNQPMLAKSIDKTGQVYNRLGETRLALEVYERVLGLYRALGRRRQEARTLNNVGLELVNQGRYADAIEPLKTSVAIFHEIGDYRRSDRRPTTSGWPTTTWARSRSRRPTTSAR